MSIKLDEEGTNTNSIKSNVLEMFVGVEKMYNLLKICSNFFNISLYLTPIPHTPHPNKIIIKYFKIQIRVRVFSTRTTVASHWDMHSFISSLNVLFKRSVTIFNTFAVLIMFVCGAFMSYVCMGRCNFRDKPKIFQLHTSSNPKMLTGEC